MVRFWQVGFQVFIVLIVLKLVLVLGLVRSAVMSWGWVRARASVGV